MPDAGSVNQFISNQIGAVRFGFDAAAQFATRDASLHRCSQNVAQLQSLIRQQVCSVSDQRANNPHFLVRQPASVITKSGGRNRNCRVANLIYSHNLKRWTPEGRRTKQRT